MLRWKGLRDVELGDCDVTSGDNPYSPPTSSSTISQVRDWERDQCPYCLHRQKVWPAVNSLGTYTCKNCGQRLTVVLSKTWYRSFQLLIAAYVFFLVTRTRAGFFFADRISTYVFPSFMILYLFLHTWFGYFHPYSKTWTTRRADLLEQSTTPEDHV